MTLLFSVPLFFYYTCLLTFTLKTLRMLWMFSNYLYVSIYSYNRPKNTLHCNIFSSLCHKPVRMLVTPLRKQFCFVIFLLCGTWYQISQFQDKRCVSFIFYLFIYSFIAFGKPRLMYLNSWRRDCEIEV